MTTDTVFAIFSTTKAITGTAALQLVEEGKLDLDAPAKNYAPDIGKLEVIEGFTESGEPKLRPPKRDVTTRMLLTHSAGLGYDFFNEKYNRLAQEKGQPSVITSSKKALMTPLLFDPGDKWEYGSNIDWCGQVIEGIAGKPERCSRPASLSALGMRDLTFKVPLTPCASGSRACTPAMPTAHWLRWTSSFLPSLRSTWAGMGFTALSARICGSFGCG